MKNKRDKKKEILIKALSSNLDKVAKYAWMHSIKDGKDLICPYCNLPIQPCKANPSAMCKEMLLSGTDDKEIIDALKNIDKNYYGICICCGRKISTAHLRKHPTADICNECIKKIRKIKKIK